MSAAFAPTPMRISREWSRSETQGDRVELIDREMLVRAPVGAKHAAATARFARLWDRTWSGRE